MKILLGLFVIWSAGQTFGVNRGSHSFLPSVVVSASPLNARSPQGSDSINLSALVGTAPSQIEAPAATDTSITKTRHKNQKTKTHKKGANLGSNETTKTPTTITITSTDVAIVTPVSSDTTTASVTTTIAPAANVVVNNGGFGGVPGVIAQTAALTAGAEVQVNNNQAFGGVVGVLQTAQTISAITSVLDNSSTSTDFTTAVDTVVATAISTLTVFETVDVTAIPLVTDSAAPTVQIMSTLVVGGDHAFGGDVGIQATPTNLISTAISFNGFGGIAGLATAPAQRIKRDLFSISVNIEGGASAQLPPPPGVDGITPRDITIFSTATVTESTTTPITTSSTTTDTATSQSDNGDVTVTVVDVVTATITATTATTTSLSPLTIADLFPECANVTSTISALQNITIPNMLLPSNITLAQVFGFTSDQVDCGILLKLLGGSNPAANLTRRFYRTQRKMKRYFRY